MKLYAQNVKGTIYRVDGFSFLKGLFPTEVDIARRCLLCLQNKIPYKPYGIALDGSNFTRLRAKMGDSNYARERYDIYDGDNNKLFVICLMEKKEG